MNNIVKASDVSLSYDKETIIKNCNIEIKQRDFIFITGKSGSGKSTFLKSLYGEIFPSYGKLEVCGYPMFRISNSKLSKLRRKIGIVFQDYKLISEWNIEKNIMLPLLIGGFSKILCQSQTQKLLSHVKLLHKAKKFPQELSGGEQQRAAVARALAHNPVLILADEPTGNLDDYSSDVVWELLIGAREHLNATVIVVTHRIPSTLRMDYRHFVLENGALNEIV